MSLLSKTDRINSELIPARDEEGGAAFKLASVIGALACERRPISGCRLETSPLFATSFFVCKIKFAGRIKGRILNRVLKHLGSRTVYLS